MGVQAGLLVIRRLNLGHLRLPPPLWLITASGFLTAHRISLGLPMLFVGQFVRRASRSLYVAFMGYEGLALMASALIPNFTWATAVWLTHDLVGAAVWLPIQKTWMQQFAKPVVLPERTGGLGGTPSSPGLEDRKAGPSWASEATLKLREGICEASFVYCCGWPFRTPAGTWT